MRFSIPLNLASLRPDFTFDQILQSAEIQKLPDIRKPPAKSLNSTQQGFGIFTRQEPLLVGPLGTAKKMAHRADSQPFNRDLLTIKNEIGTQAAFESVHDVESSIFAHDLVQVEEPSFELHSKGIVSPRYTKPQINFQAINVHNPEHLRDLGRYYSSL